MNKTAIIYVKKGDREIEQKLFCQIYALENNLDVVDIVKDFDEVDNCDVVLVANHHTISRDAIEYYGIMNELKDRGVEVKVAINEENAGRYIELITRELKKVKVR